MKELLAKHSRGVNGSLIVLGGAISWHSDGGHATDTVQVTLNDDTEYDGSRLCYSTEENGGQVLQRRAGDITKHGR